MVRVQVPGPEGAAERRAGWCAKALLEARWPRSAMVVGWLADKARRVVGEVQQGARDFRREDWR